MENIDVKDRKILYHLDLDSRQSFRSLGKKVGLSKDAVTKRVKKLQEKKIIKGYYAIIDHAKLGYNYYRFYFSLQNVTPDLKKEIISYFVNNKHTDTVFSLEGSYDLMVFIVVKSFPDAHSFWQKTLKLYGKYFSKKVFTAYCQEDHYGHRFLLDNKENNRTNRKIIYQWYTTGKIVKIDDIDFQIIQIITQNSRINTTDIAEALNSTSTVIHYRLKKLINSDLIIGYRTNIDFTKLGFYVYKVDIELNQFDKLDKIIKYIEANPNLIEIIKTIGYVDIEACFVLNNTYQLNQIMEYMSSKFPDSIKKYTYFITINEHKVYGF